MRSLIVIILGLAVSTSISAQVLSRERQGTPVIPTNRLTTSESVNATGNTSQGVAQSACLHGLGETPAEAARRTDAIRIMRAINTAQTQSFATNRVYQNFAQLTASGLSSRPAGFQTQLTVEGSTYALVVRDTIDPCRYTLFNDQDGVIYVGSPLQ